MQRVEITRSPQTADACTKKVPSITQKHSKVSRSVMMRIHVRHIKSTTIQVFFLRALKIKHDIIYYRHRTLLLAGIDNTLITPLILNNILYCSS